MLRGGGGLMSAVLELLEICIFHVAFVRSRVLVPEIYSLVRISCLSGGGNVGILWVSWIFE